MNQLSVFSIGTTDAITCNRDIIVADGYHAAVDLFMTLHPRYSWDLSIHQRGKWAKVLVTDYKGRTQLKKVMELIDVAKAMGQTPVLVGKQYGLSLFIIDSEFGVIARSVEDALVHLQTLLSTERFQQLEGRLHALPRNLEPKETECVESNPVVRPYGTQAIITIEKRGIPVTRTVDQHVRTAAYKGIGRAYLLFLVGVDGIMRNPED